MESLVAQRNKMHACNISTAVKHAKQHETFF